MEVVRENETTSLYEANNGGVSMPEKLLCRKPSRKPNNMIQPLLESEIQTILGQHPIL